MKFKIGDRVSMIKSPTKWTKQFLGKEAVVTRIDSSRHLWPVQIYVYDIHSWWNEDELELL
jgi:hypothetical protein